MIDTETLDRHVLVLWQQYTATGRVAHAMLFVREPVPGDLRSRLAAARYPLGWAVLHEDVRYGLACRQPGGEMVDAEVSAPRCRSCVQVLAQIDRNAR